jgi:hypothetical protein
MKTALSPSFSDSLHILRLENNKTKTIDGQVRLVLLARLIRLYVFVNNIYIFFPFAVYRYKYICRKRKRQTSVHLLQTETENDKR